jgi:cobaltochelatase CobS
MTREQYEQVIATTGNEQIKKMAQAELQKLDIIEKAAEGDTLSKALLTLKDVVDKYKPTAGSPTGGTAGGGVSKQEVEEMLKQVLKQSKISYDDLDPELRAKLSGQVKVQLELKTPISNYASPSSILMYEFERPLFQLLLSDWKARNNAYLYGGAGTGKTTIAKKIAKFLGYNLVIVNCNQFTSPLDLLGGQTITGYQKGRLEMAWSNIDENGNPMRGAVLLLDELPKIDPNSAGILNEALASVKDYSGGEPPTIRNGRGQELSLGNMFVIATGNVKLNETSVEYEANFKQDLSLQDRFSGSTYEIFVDYNNEFTNIMKGFAFIWIYMTKLRELIFEEKWAGFGFVSIRIMMSMRDSYIVSRDISKQKVGTDLSLLQPKTLKQALDSFLNLFTPSQKASLKQKSDYDKFMSTIIAKSKLDINNLDTPEELEIGAKMIKTNEALIEAKYN